VTAHPSTEVGINNVEYLGIKFSDQYTVLLNSVCVGY